MGNPGSFEKCLPAPTPPVPEQTPAPLALTCSFLPKALGEPLYRVSTGNYEYRLVLRCRQEARARFSQMRKDVLEKMELLDQKHVQDIVFQLQRFVSTMSKYYNDCYAVLRDADVFPIEVDLAHTTLAYGLSQDEFTDGEDEDEDEDTAAGEPSRDARGAAGPLDKGGSWCGS
uniref:Protein interacting with PRKCA 1 n=1 Tax=Molossus molossus TaxID=27622 RepID=A0A7J8G0M2_MOLMO|nr:protein interacting with PRKCA 1 [Molossus molossus]